MNIFATKNNIKIKIGVFIEDDFINSCVLFQHKEILLKLKTLDYILVTDKHCNEDINFELLIDNFEKFNKFIDINDILSFTITSDIYLTIKNLLESISIPLINDNEILILTDKKYVNRIYQLAHLYNIKINLKPIKLFNSDYYMEIKALENIKNKLFLFLINVLKKNQNTNLFDNNLLKIINDNNFDELADISLEIENLLIKDSFITKHLLTGNNTPVTDEMRSIIQSIIEIRDDFNNLSPTNVKGNFVFEKYVQNIDFSYGNLGLNLINYFYLNKIKNNDFNKDNSIINTINLINILIELIPLSLLDEFSKDYYTSFLNKFNIFINIDYVNELKSNSNIYEHLMQIVYNDERNIEYLYENGLLNEKEYLKLNIKNNLIRNIINILDVTYLDLEKTK